MSLAASNRQLIIYTPPKKFSSFKFLDFFVILICLSIASVCVYFFYLSLTQTLTSDLDPVGTVTIKYNSVQRRMGDRVLWDRIFNESPLYPGDIVRVAEYSGATLNFNNNQIELEDNTLIRVTVDRTGQPRIELSSGTLNFASSEESGNISLVIGGRVIEAEQNTVLSVTAADEEMTLKVIEGSATITADETDETNEATETIEITSGTMITVESEQTLETVVIEEYVPIEEPVTENIVLEEIDEPETENVVLELFEEPEIVNVPQTPIQPPPPLVPLPLSAPANMRPARGYTINAAQFRTLRSIDFSWSSVNGANAYILTIFHETANGRRQITRTNPLTNTRWSLTDLTLLDRGTFIWQVEAISRNPNGVIQRRGTVGESSFIINVPIPEVQLNETRNLYDQ